MSMNIVRVHVRVDSMFMSMPGVNNYVCVNGGFATLCLFFPAQDGCKISLKFFSVLWKPKYTSKSNLSQKGNGLLKFICDFIEMSDSGSSDQFVSNWKIGILVIGP
jgi:hypothetical protein